MSDKQKILYWIEYFVYFEDWMERLIYEDGPYETLEDTTRDLIHLLKLRFTYYWRVWMPKS